jgi:site-specific DNA-methyltransferase (adenine-specific)
MNNLFFGDNLKWLRDVSIFPNDFVDLIYLDPPYNSKRGYNLLFKSPAGDMSEAQIEAFEDTWHWNEQAEREFDELFHQPNTAVAEMMKSLRAFLGENDMMAYLTMMANRLIQLQRVLKPTGSIYLHCDPTASHYLKVVMDAIFGKENFINEIIWYKNSGGIGRTSFSKRHDTLLLYGKTEDYFYDGKALGELREQEKGTFGGYFGKDEDGREYRECRKGGKVYKYYMDEPRNPEDVWEIAQIPERDKTERLGYPTQKPEALLERVIKASSKPGGIVLDPFCGCGTAVHVAQKLKREWIGIDITHLAISLIEKRLKNAFKTGLEFEVHGTPKDLAGARNLAARDKYQFQWWAVSLVEAQPFQGKKKGADTGIDGIKFFRDIDQKDVKKIVVSVKGGENLKADDVRALNHVREREGAEIALFISLEETTKGMKADAASAGFYDSPNGKKFSRVQLLTIEGLLNKSQRADHPDYDPNLNFRKAEAHPLVKQAEFGK